MKSATQMRARRNGELDHSPDRDSCSPDVEKTEVQAVYCENLIRMTLQEDGCTFGQDPKLPVPQQNQLRRSYEGAQVCLGCLDGIVDFDAGEECEPASKPGAPPGDFMCPGRCNTNCKCEPEKEDPSVYFVVDGTMAHDPVGTREYVDTEGTNVSWHVSIPDASTSNSTGSASVTGHAANNQATVDFDITYKGSGTTGLGYSGGIQVWITGEIGQRYRFKWTNTWTITNQGGANSYAEWNGKTISSSLHYDKPFTIDGYNREVDIPGVGKVPYVFVFDFPRETTGGVWGIVHAFGGSVKARVEISVEFLD